MQNSFELLKQKFSEYPVLQFPNFEQEFILETDANLKRIAALLNQLKDGLVALVSCASRVLSKHERGITVFQNLNCSVLSGLLNTFNPTCLAEPFKLLQITKH